MLGAWLFGLDHCLPVARGSMARAVGVEGPGVDGPGVEARAVGVEGRRVAGCRGPARGSMALDLTKATGNMGVFFY